MFWFKSCPKCETGDLYEGQDQYGRYIACIQCSHYLTAVEEAVLRYMTSMGSASSQEAAPQAEEATPSHKSLAEVG
jgi:hypothetical protein